MITSVEFLREKLQMIADKFQNVHIKYGYNYKIDSHIVELLPLFEYSTNKELDKTWIPISIEFMEKFKDEEVVFISSDSSLRLEETIFEFNTSICSEEKIITEVFAPLTEKLVDYSFSTSVPDGKFIYSDFMDIVNLPIEIVTENIQNQEDLSYLAAA